MIIASDIHAYKEKPMLVNRIDSALKRDRHRTLILAGDLTCGAREEEYDRVAQWLYSLIEEGTNVVLAVGNHDMSTSLLVTRVPNADGYKRYSALLDLVESQPIVVARMNEFDALYCIGRDVFYAARSTHSKPYKGSRVKKSQFYMATECLVTTGLIPENGYRLHLVTHQSLWHLDGDAHGHIHKRKRLVEHLLQPMGFVTAINGHNHRFEAASREVKKTGFNIYHIQAPSLSMKTKGKFTPGFVSWDPGVRNSAKFISV